MSVRRLIGLIPVATLLAACTGQSPIPIVPFHTAEAGGALVTGEALGVSAEEEAAARAPQPALHALQTSQFIDALVRKHPDATMPLRALEKRALALSKLQLRAAHALALEDLKTMTLSGFAELMQRWMDRPVEFLAYGRSLLDRVAGLDARQTIRIARKLPAALIAMEALGGDVPTKPTEAKGMSLRHRVIRDVISLLKARQPDRTEALDTLQKRLLALTPEQMRAIHAIAWKEDKGKTLSEVMERLTKLIETPGAYADYIQGYLTKLQDLTAQGQDALVASYPPALAQLEDILYGPQPAAAKGQAQTARTP